MQITKLIVPMTYKSFSKTDGVHDYTLGTIRLPKFFKNKTIKVMIMEDGGITETIEKRVASSGSNSVILLHGRYVGKKCILEIVDGDIFEYFKVRYDESVRTQ